MPPRAANKSDRIFVRDGRRHYRRSFSLTEPRIGIAILVALAAVVAWVGWRGAHPDPSLFMLEADLSQAGTVGAAGASVASADRGPMPTGLASAGWTEGDVSQFDYDNVYEKIDGREGYYKAFGFERLYCASIAAAADPQTAVDIELYDLGNAANAVGAYSGERPSEVTPEVGETGLAHMDRNALFMTRGRYYLRAIGSAESPEVTAALAHLRGRFEAELAGEPLPWGYALFIGRMGMNPGAVTYARENAFSFGFARNVYSAALGDGDAAVFVTPSESESAAAALASRYRDGFLQYGAAEGDFVKDRYLGTLAGVRSAGAWVVGFRGATDGAAASAALGRLADAVEDFPLPAEAAEPPANDSVEETYESLDGTSDEY